MAFDYVYDFVNLTKFVKLISHKQFYCTVFYYTLITSLFQNSYASGKKFNSVLYNIAHLTSFISRNKIKPLVLHKLVFRNSKNTKRNINCHYLVEKHDKY